MEGIKSVTVIIFNKDKVLLVKNGPSSNHPTGLYGLPAGRVEPDETCEEAAVRECTEESGLKPKKLIKLPTFYEANLARKDGVPQKFVCWSFYCPEFEGELKSTDETEPLWVNISEVSKLPLVTNVDKMINEAKIFSEKNIF